MPLEFLKTAGHCIHDISGNRFTPKGSCGWHINSSSQWQQWLPSPLLLPYKQQNNKSETGAVPKHSTRI
jgi:hypothetical protein